MVLKAIRGQIAVVPLFAAVPVNSLKFACKARVQDHFDSLTSHKDPKVASKLRLYYTYSDVM